MERDYTNWGVDVDRADRGCIANTKTGMYSAGRTFVDLAYEYISIGLYLAKASCRGYSSAYIDYNSIELIRFVLTAFNVAE